MSFSGLVGFVFSPHLCMGFLFLIVRSCPLLLPPASRRLAHNHTTYSHTTYSHTTYSHAHTAYSHTSHAHTHTHNLLTTYSHTHNSYTHTHAHSLLTHNSHTHSSPTHNSPAHKLSLCVAGVFLVTSSFTLCGKRGTDGAGLALVARLVPVCRRGRRGSLCVAGLALGDVDLQFVWQVWR